MKSAVVVGAGPAGLMAAEVLTDAGVQVDVYDAMPSAGRKFLLAGIGGLNLTHNEASAEFLSRYGTRQREITALLADFDASALRQWALGLGIPTFVGSSGRVFPVGMKAAPLLRAWLQRLRHPPRGPAVRFHMRHRWTGRADPDDLCRGLEFQTTAGMVRVAADVVVFALGGASWSRLGSDGAWVAPLRDRGVTVHTLVPANCGFDVAGGWSPVFASRCAGQPFKSVRLRCAAAAGEWFERKGEFVATATGIEGSLVYAASAWLRDTIAGTGRANLYLDLLPDMDAARVLAEVGHARGSRSLSSHLKSRLGIDGIKAGLLYELLPRAVMNDPRQLALAIKNLPLTLAAPRPLDEAISSAGGVCFDAMTEQLMLLSAPGAFCAGEMLDWEAPTGGYLLTACLASGRVAGLGALQWLRQ